MSGVSGLDEVAPTQGVKPKLSSQADSLLQPGSWPYPLPLQERVVVTVPRTLHPACPVSLIGGLLVWAEMTGFQTLVLPPLPSLTADG